MILYELTTKDTDKVLSTVASTLYIFFEHYQGTIVIAEGSTRSRTRLYRRYLSAFLELIESEFNLLGNSTAKQSVLERGIDYKFFLISQKI